LKNEGEVPYSYFLWFRDNAKMNGNGRSIDYTAEHFDKSPRTFYQYSRRFKWQDRAKAWDDRIVAEQDKAILSEQAKMAKDHLSSLGLMRAVGTTTLARVLKKARANEEMLPSTVREANALIRDAVTGERLVTDQATSRNEDGSLDLSKLEAGEKATLLELLKKAGYEG
jgi:hypothetical protein